MSTSSTRQHTLTNAILACLTGRASLCEQVFTADVTCTSPTMAARSRDELETLLSSRADALSEIDLVIDRLVDDGTVAVAEWHTAATRDLGYVIPEDSVLDSRGQRLSLTGVTLADFTGSRISSIRHYFDKAALLAQLSVEG